MIKSYSETQRSLIFVGFILIFMILAVAVTARVITVIRLEARKAQAMSDYIACMDLIKSRGLVPGFKDEKVCKSLTGYVEIKN